MRKTWRVWFGVPFAALALAVGLGPAAWAAGGQSTPGVTVTAQNPGAAGEPSGLRLTLTAHSQVSAVADPSCRPQDANIQCWGDLVLRIPEAGGLTLSGLQVHRIAVGDTACGGDEGGDSCGDMTAALTPDGSYPVNAQVNGLSVITDPGSTSYPAGTQVQVKIALTDNGGAQYADMASVQVNEFVPGMDKPLIWQTAAPQVIQQVQIHFDTG